jgi:hypothetical protein
MKLIGFEVNMAQFYFLSVLLNVLAGLILVYGKNLSSAAGFSDDDLDFDDESAKNSSGNLDFDSPIFRLIVGVLCIFVAVMKILSVFRNDVPVVGDLLPVLAGFASGISILLEYYLSTSSEKENFPENLKRIFIDSRRYIGIAAIAVGILHFIFPQIVLL